MKITKTQLRQIIKEEVQKELDEGFLDFLTGGGLSATDKDIIARRTADLMDSGVKRFAAKEQAEKELKAKLLDRMGKLKSSGKSSEPEGEPDWRSTKFSDKERAEIAGMKRQQRNQRNASRPTYADHSSDAEARKTLRARSAQYRR